MRSRRAWFALSPVIVGSFAALGLATGWSYRRPAAAPSRAGSDVATR